MVAVIECPPFADDIQCPKCTRYAAPEWHTETPKDYGGCDVEDCLGPSVEHICWRSSCGFSWQTLTADFKSPVPA